MNLFIYTGASRLNAAVVESATDLTPVSRLPDLIVGDSEPVTVKFLSASGAYESWSGGGTYTLSISIGALGADGVGAYFQTSSFTAVTNGWTGRLDLAASALRSAVGGYLADRPGVTGAPLTLQVRVTDASGNTETYARQSVVISGAVSVPTTADSTPVTYATAADVAADAATASAAAIAAAASASAASGSASTAAGHVTTAGNSATAAAASATTAGNSATTASGHATTATTQATNAATSASSASTYKDAAAVSAASATSSAGTATTQAALATTNGAAQVTLATTQATNAGTSASAAAISAAAALVSEAAALVSKNAAAASAATASAVSGSGNGTFSAAALTGVNSITASTSTPLTLTGGSTGASLVLGNTNTGASLGGGGLAVGSSASFVVGATAGVSTNAVGVPQISASSNTYSSIASIAHNTTDGNHGFIVTGKSRGTKASPTILADGDTFGEYAFVAYDGAAYRTSAGIKGIISGTPGAGDLPTRLSFSVAADGAPSTTERMNLMPTGNLLIGTTTDAASLAGGLVINGSGAGAAASSTTTGALRVTGGVGVSGAGYFGAGANLSGSMNAFGGPLSISFTGNPIMSLKTSAIGVGESYGYGIGDAASSGRSTFFGHGKDASGNYYGNIETYGASVPIFLRSSYVGITATTSASNSYTGALVVGNGLVGSAGVNVAIGGGKVNIGSTEASINSTSGALQVAGGIYAGAASVFGGAVTATGPGFVSSGNGEIALIAQNSSNIGRIQFKKTAATAQTWQVGTSGNDGTSLAFCIDDAMTGATRMKIAATTGDITFGTGAATFAGDVTIGGTGFLSAARSVYTTGAVATPIANSAVMDWSGGFARFWGVGADAATAGGLKLVVSATDTSPFIEALTITSTGAATFAGVVIKKNYTVATLPAAASYTYGEAYVSDATQAAGTSLGSAPTGGGAVKRGVYSDGSSWLLR